MDKGIAVTERSNDAFVDVEFTEGEELGIPDDKANSLPSPNASSPRSCHAEKPVRCKQLSHPLLDDNLLHTLTLMV